MFLRACIAAFVLVLAFVGGAFQHRQGGWPFGGGAATTVVRALRISPEDDKIRRDKIHHDKIAYWVSQLRKGGLSSVHTACPSGQMAERHRVRPL